jgi:hypothetical protein
MSQRLREALRVAAAEVPAYPVYERAVATARRGRWRAVAAVAAAVLAAVALALLPAGPEVLAGTAGSGAPTLPDRIAGPVLGALPATDWPRLGPAALAFTGGRCVLGEDCDTVTVVGATADRYRVFDVGGNAPTGVRVVLSPDGRRIAYPTGYGASTRLAILDLGTGRVHSIRPASTGSVQVVPVGWSPDGRRVAVLDTVPGAGTVLSLVDLDTGGRVRLGLGPTLDGYTVAFAPDGQRLAYQLGAGITVAALDGRTLGYLPLPDGAALAGKGAWTPDGSSVTVVEPAGGAWRLAYLDPITGRVTGGPATSAVSGVAAIRLLGWRQGGTAIVAAYRPEPAVPPLRNPSMTERTSYGNVRTVELLALAPGAATPTVLLTAPDTAKAIDVADNVLASGQTRTAHPPVLPGPLFWFWTVVAVALVTIAFGWYRRQKARSVYSGRT